jgi:hypothetical protein
MGLFFQWVDGNLIITNWGLLAVCMIPGILYGLKRGWQEEGFTAIGLGLIVTGLGQRFGEFLIMILNGIASVFPVGLALILGRPLPEPGAGLISPTDPWAELGAFVVMALVAYRAGTILGRRRGVGLLGKLAGSLFGAMNTILILARVFQISRPLEQETVVQPPKITIMGMPADWLQGFIIGMIGLIIAMFLTMAWLQRRRAKE